MAERTIRDRIKPATAIWAEDAAKNSRLPGYGNGPGDAYRHIIWIAETARTSGSGPAWAIGEANEQVGFGNPRDETIMDRHNNNEIALRIARNAKSRDDVERLAQAEIVAAYIENGSGKNGTAVWLSRDRWHQPDEWPAPTNWPPKWDDEPAKRVERLLTLPIEDWSEDDIRTIQASRLYRNGDDPRRKEALAKVAQWFDSSESRRRNQLRTSYGPVTVDPYTRDDGTKVEGHTRSLPHR